MEPSLGSTKTQLERLERASLRLLGDERLARIAASGDRLAFAVIFDRYQHDLFGYCASILHDRDDAADAVQNTMVKALNALDGERRHIALRPWLYRIAHNESVDLLRRSRPESEPEGEVVAMADVEGDAATRDRLRTVLSDIQQLPERQRGALVMRELSGLSYSDIADALETTPAGAKQAVYDARIALHDLARGRDTDCASVRVKLSDGDRRVFRARTIRAHLKACADCRGFQAQIASRESSLASFTPAMPAAAAASALQGALTGGAAGAAAGSAAGVGASAAALPAISAVAVAVALGAGAVGLGVHELATGNGHDSPRAMAEASPDPSSAAAAVERARRAGSDGARGNARERAAARAERRRADARSGNGASGASAGRHKRGKGEAGSDDAALTGRSGAGGTTARTDGSESTGIQAWVRGRGSSPSGGSSGNGPVRTGVGDVRTGVQNTVTQVQEALPVETPPLPAPVVRPPRDGGTP
jgi:RNA polymerase sigma factor (sigma-70 family)